MLYHNHGKLNKKNVSVTHKLKKNFAFLYKILNVNFSYYGLKEQKSVIKIVVGMLRRRKYKNITIKKTCKICQFRIM